MASTTILLILAVLGIVGFFLGRARAYQVAGGDMRNLHSLPIYYGAHVGLNAVVPAALLFFVWLIAQPFMVNNSTSGLIADSSYETSGDLSLIMSDVRRVAEGLELLAPENGLSEDDVAAISTQDGNLREDLASVGVALGADVQPDTLAAAKRYRTMQATGAAIRSILVIFAGLAGLFVAWRMIDPVFRARNVVERGVLLVLIGSATIAILTTVGIVLSLVFNTYEFFKLYPISDFFFGLSWAPSFSGRGGSSELGILPLLWGTFYISLIALLVAVPMARKERTIRRGISNTLCRGQRRARKCDSARG